MKKTNRLWSNKNFNNKLARLRIISEHCIGMLKGRFPWLRSIRLQLTEEKRSIKNILKLVDATVILHNLLIEIREEERKDWIDEDDFSDVDDADRAPDLDGDDILNQGIPAGADKAERRTRLQHYFEEHYYF